MVTLINVSPVLNPGKHLFLKTVEITIDAPECINPLKTGFAKENRRKTNYQKRDNVVESAQKKKNTTTCWRGGEKPLMIYRLFSCFKARKYSVKKHLFANNVCISFHIGLPASANLHPSDAGSQSSEIEYFYDKDNATMGFTT